jgi:hypothetical protein
MKSNRRSGSNVLRTVWLAPALALALACGSGGHGNDGGSGADGSGGGDGTVNGGDGSHLLPDGAPNDGSVVVNTDAGRTVHDPDGGAWTCIPITCANHQTECGDCMDNDGDGLIDSHDPDCIGPCSNSEANLFGSVGGSSASACNLNCYFDFGQGGGTGCSWDHECDPLTPVTNCPFVAPASRNPGLAMHCPAMQSAACHSECEPLTPNGCDCFGCCQFGSDFLYIGTRDSSGNATCTIERARMHDTTACHPCTPVTDPVTHGFSCGNSCGACEYCIDGHVPDPSCFSTPPPDAGVTQPDGAVVHPDAGINTMQCPAGITPCDAAGNCPMGSYCITGCCEVAPM